MSTTQTEKATGFDLARRVGFADPAYADVMDFLTLEAALLDSDRQEEWLTLVAEDVMYTLPNRKTVHRSDGSGVEPGGGSFADTHASLALRVRRNVVTEFAFDRDPPPRTRRLVTNVTVFRTDVENEYRANSYVVLLRNQLNQVDYDMLTGLREDVLRTTDDGLRLARRHVIVDMCTLGAPWPNVIM